MIGATAKVRSLCAADLFRKSHLSSAAAPGPADKLAKLVNATSASRSVQSN
jgi:hypothetical protein